MQPTIKMKGSGAVTDTDKAEIDRNLRLLDETLIRLALLMDAQLIIEHTNEVLMTLQAHKNLMSGKASI